MNNFIVQQDLPEAEAARQENARALVSIVPVHVAEEMKKLSDEDLNKSEFELAKELKPTPFANQIRMNFWNEYMRAQRRGQRMSMINVYSGLCSKSSFHDNILKRRHNLLWVVTPPADLMVAAQDALWLATRFMRKIYEDMPLFTEEKLDTAQAQLGLRAFEVLRNIVHGTLVQRLETKSLNLNVTAGSDVKAMDHEEIKKRIKELEAIPAVDIEDKG